MLQKLRKILGSITISLVTLVWALAASAADTTLYLGRLGTFKASFHEYGSHLRGVVQMSTARFKDAAGKIVPYTALTFKLTSTSSGVQTICFQHLATRCDPVPADPAVLVPLMKWIERGSEALFSLAEERSFKKLAEIGMQPVVVPLRDGEYVAQDFNTAALVNLMRTIDYYNVTGMPIETADSARAIAVLNQGIDRPEWDEEIDASYTVTDYFSRFVVTIRADKTDFSGVPHLLHWTLASNSPPYVTHIEPLLSPTDDLAELREAADGPEHIAGQRRIFSFYYTAAILRGLRQAQPQTFQQLKAQLSN